VNRIIILMLVALAVLFCNLDSLFAAADSNSTSQTKSVTPAKAEKAKVTFKPGSKSDANAPAAPKKIDPNTDPNTAKSKALEELDKALENIVNENEQKRVERTQRSAENRIENIKLYYSHVATELNLIRKVAIEEKAEKTVEAIDRVLENRSKRLEKRLAEIEDERKTERQKEREERREKEREKQQRLEERRRRDRDK